MTPSRPTTDEISAATSRLTQYLCPTPLVPLNIDLPDRKIFLKLETMTPIGAFKLRPALNALLARDRKTLLGGVATVSSGNMAYGMAWAANALKIPMAAYMYADAPKTKINNVRKLGGDVRFVTHDMWWRYITGIEAPDQTELMINPVTDQAVLAGNATIGQEILSDLPEVDCILTPFGGGSLTTGVATAAKLARPNIKVFAVEGAHAAPVSAAIKSGQICEVPTEDSFVKSIGGPSVVPALWPVVRDLIDGAIVVDLPEIVGAMNCLFSQTRVVAEGAGAASLAAALRDPRATGNVVCVISGGNIDSKAYVQALLGEVPPP